jgi:hypothetical protein
MSDPLDPQRLCSDDAPRRAFVPKEGAGWNGIDSVEPDPADAKKLYVYLIRPLSKQFYEKFHDNPPRTSVTVDGGERVRGLRVQSVSVRRAQEHSSQDDALVVLVDREGDFSTYTMRLDAATFPQGGHGFPYPDRFDPYYATAAFNFKTDCPNPLDCAPAASCQAEPPPEPVISYLGRDYAGLRQTVFDRLAQVIPDWTERHVPDLGVALVELFSYVGDGLSYFQDAVATEAYLGTARLRTSVRRHVRLIDYSMHEGCNSRAWVVVNVPDPGDVQQPDDKTVPVTAAELSADLLFLAGADSLPVGVPVSDDQRRKLPPGTVGVFELLADRARSPWPKDPARPSDDPVRVFPGNDEIPFYTWRNQECVLPCGSTRATLKGRLWAALWPPDTSPCPPQPKYDPAHDLYLRPGDFLLLEEIRGPVTGALADADPAHRHVVVLATVTPGHDPVTGDDIVDVEWDSDDALPFALCLSATSPKDSTCVQQPVSVARGNVLLVDQGETVGDESLPPVPVAPSLALPSCQGEGPVVMPPDVPGRYRPALQRGPLTWAEPLRKTAEGELLSAAEMPAQDPRAALPAIVLLQAEGGRASALPPALTTANAGLLDDPAPDGALVWTARRDLLASGPTDPHFVPEPEDDGRTYLRFGDDEHGRAVRVGDTFSADYRVGNGPAGNVGRERINRLGLPSGAGLTVRNPLPASGGTDPEPLVEVKRLAPEAFHTDLRRAVVPDDYAKLVTTRYPEARRAAATRRWTGAGDLIVVAVDFRAAAPQARRDSLLKQDIPNYLEAFRRIGHAVSVREAAFAALDVALDVFLLPTALRGPTVARLRQLFGTVPLPGGGLGFFDPDNFAFGQGVAASQLVALAQGVSGVEHVVVTRLRRVGSTGGPDAPPFLAVGPLEVVRLDNDPNRAENGRLNLNVRGGR